MKFVADLHLHSRYSRACSQSLTLENLALWAGKKGIQVLATGDWTHPVWFEELKNKLEQAENGLYRLKTNDKRLTQKKALDVPPLALSEKEVYFLLSTEISSIYSQGGKQRRIHNLVFAPNFETVEKINKQLAQLGANLKSDGRPIIGLSAKNLAELVLEIEPQSLIVPAHCWTPWFSLYGSNSGFDTVSECFGDMEKYIFAVETGLSSDPAMNWRIEDLDNRTILSFSDAHSLEKLGREATVFDGDLTYSGIYQAIRNEPNETKEPKGPREEKTSGPSGTSGSYGPSTKVAFTIEFYPEEGKYHYTGHRNCGVKHSPAETAKLGTTCPVCGKKLTVGVMHRVEDLATRSIEDLQLVNHDFIKSGTLPSRPPYKMLIPLQEVIAQSLGLGEASKEVSTNYDNLITNFGSELAVLIKTSLEELAGRTSDKIVRAIEKVRRGDIFVDPGFDGVYGRVQIWPDAAQETQESSQMALF